MKTINQAGFSFHLGDEFVIFELDDAVDELTRPMLEQSTNMLLEEYEKPFGIIFPRGHRVAIDLLAARELMEKRLSNLVGIANVASDPTTLMSVEYEKTIIDLVPIESFEAMRDAVGWVTEKVREKRNGG